jgi:hypothetical protein
MVQLADNHFLKRRCYGARLRIDAGFRKQLP